jgi:cytochrome P450
LIELARNPGVQDALRKELRDNFATSDPTWDELATGLPMLDAVVHETLRLHSAVQETVRQVTPSSPITI